MLSGFDSNVTNIVHQVWIQMAGVMVTIMYTDVVTVVILLVISKTMGLRVAEEAEVIGLDLYSHNERGYNL